MNNKYLWGRGHRGGGRKHVTKKALLFSGTTREGFIVRGGEELNTLGDLSKERDRQVLLRLGERTT